MVCLCSHERRLHYLDGACGACGCLQYEAGPSDGVPRVYQPKELVIRPIHLVSDVAKQQERVPMGSMPREDE